MATHNLHQVSFQVDLQAKWPVQIRVQYCAKALGIYGEKKNVNEDSFKKY